MTPSYADSLARRLRAAHSLYHDAMHSMSLEQVNAVVHPRALPIAFSLVHQVLIEDASRALVGGPAALFNATWADRLGLGVA